MHINYFQESTFLQPTVYVEPDQTYVVYFDQRRRAEQPFAGRKTLSGPNTTFPSITKQDKQKIKGKPLKIMQNT